MLKIHPYAAIAALPRYRVLVAMRDPALRHMLSSTLESAGCLVRQAFDDRDMLTELAGAAVPFHCVLRDGRLEPWHVFDGLEQLRSVDPAVPAIVIAGRSGPALAAGLARHDASLLEIPVSSWRLIAAVVAAAEPELVAEEAELTAAA